MGLENLLVRGKKFLRNAALAGMISSSILLGACAQESGNKNSSSSSNSSSGGGGGGGGSGGTTNQTHVMTSSELDQISYVDSSTLNFYQPVSLSVGNIIVAGISGQTPNGLLRKVTSKSSDGRTIYTAQSTLEEALKSASFTYDQTLDPNNATISMMDKNPAQIPASVNFSIPISNLVLYDADGNPSTTSDQIVANGNLSFNSEFLFDFRISNSRLTRILFENITTENLDLSVNALSSLGNISKNVKITEYNFSPFVVYTPTIPPFPIVIQPQIQLFADLTGNISPTTANLSQSSSLNVGVYYESGLWNMINNSSSNVTGSATLSSASSMKASIGPRLNLLFYGVAGMFGDASGFLEFNSGNSSWNLYGGLNANVGVDMGIFSSYVPDYSVTAFYQKWPVANGQFQPPPPPVPVKKEKILFARMTDFNGSFYANKDIYTINTDGSGLTNITNTPNVYEEDPAWSPDGMKIAFVKNKNIYSMDLSTKNVVQLTNNFSNNYRPAWSPNGKNIAFVSDKTGDLEIWIMNSDGSNPKNLTQDSSRDDNDPSWSPDGTEIAFSSSPIQNSFGGDIYKINVSSRQVTKLTSNGDYNITPAWSPDGNWIAFSNHACNLWILSPKNFFGRQITSDCGSNNRANFSPNWSPSGDKLVYLSDVADGYGKPAIRIMNPNTYATTEISGRDVNSSPSWSPIPVQ